MFDFLKSKKSFLSEGLLKGAVDNHSHILFGVDDGVRKLSESLSVLSLMEQQGVKKLWLTPHTMEDVPNTTEGLKARFEELKAAYSGPIELNLASEYMIDTLFEERLAAKDLLYHGEDKVLVETSTWNPPINLWEVLERMMKMGIRPIVAHPERYRYMTKDDYKRLHDMGAILQLNIPSIVGYYSEGTQKRAIDLLEKGWYSMIGSDCHKEIVLEKHLQMKTLSKSVVEMLGPLMNEG
ncbi:MAG: capsular biosynthesis protein [Bacteroidales bacterium]|nr:capsular biosynthesis protein [Bacteroidales bacterium]